MISVDTMSTGGFPHDTNTWPIGDQMLDDVAMVSNSSGENSVATQMYPQQIQVHPHTQPHMTTAAYPDVLASGNRSPPQILASHQSPPDYHFSHPHGQMVTSQETLTKSNPAIVEHPALKPGVRVSCRGCLRRKKKCQWESPGAPCTRCGRMNSVCVVDGFGISSEPIYFSGSVTTSFSTAEPVDVPMYGSVDDRHDRRRVSPDASVVSTHQIQRVDNGPSMSSMQLSADYTRGVYLWHFERTLNATLGFYPRAFLESLREDRVLERGLLATAMAWGVRSAGGGAESQPLHELALQISDNNAAHGSAVSMEHCLLDIMLMVYQPIDFGECMAQARVHARRAFSNARDLWERTNPDTRLQDPRSRQILDFAVVCSGWLMASGDEPEMFFSDAAQQVLREPTTPENVLMKQHINMSVTGVTHRKLKGHTDMILSLAQIPSALTPESSSPPSSPASVGECDLDENEVPLLHSALEEAYTTLIGQPYPAVLNRMTTCMLHHKVGNVEALASAAWDIDREIKSVQNSGMGSPGEVFDTFQQQILIVAAALYLTGLVEPLVALRECFQLMGAKAQREVEVCSVWLERIRLANE
eukprot:GFYU01003477.1.p1 GENE.GFYU01003477.1~~GFYU01003477.1.p1  ORF type:complete len:587 (-),score=86.59 GFYU01003477.1:194-1954(-)